MTVFQSLRREGQVPSRPNSGVAIESTHNISCGICIRVTSLRTEVHVHPVHEGDLSGDMP